MVKLNFDLLQKAELYQDPCPHVVVKNFISSADINFLQAQKPLIEKGGSFVPESLSLSDDFKDLIQQLKSDKTKRQFGKKFSLDFTPCKSTLTIRGRTRKKDGTIHVDSDEKELTVLLYLNAIDSKWDTPAGKLRFLKGANDLEDYTTEVSPEGGTLVAFPKNKNAWHGHHSFEGERLCIQLNYLRTHGHAYYSYFRHYLSGILKKYFG